jgi:hypothetical protein
MPAANKEDVKKLNMVKTDVSFRVILMKKKIHVLLIYLINISKITIATE